MFGFGDLAGFRDLVGLVLTFDCVEDLNGLDIW